MANKNSKLSQRGFIFIFFDGGGGGKGGVFNIKNNDSGIYKNDPHLITKDVGWGSVWCWWGK